MRDYQRKKNNKYILPTAVYHQTIWQIRDYYRIKETINDVANTSRAITYDSDKIQSSPNSDVVFDAAVKISTMSDIIRIIDEAKGNIPEEYQAGVWNNIHFGTAFPLDAARGTYSRYKSRFIYNVAVGLRLI